MSTYMICDGNDYLKWFGNNCVWFTQIRCEAITFEHLEEAEIVARTLSPLASSGLRVETKAKEQLPPRESWT